MNLTRKKAGLTTLQVIEKLKECRYKANVEFDVVNNDVGYFQLNVGYEVGNDSYFYTYCSEDDEHYCSRHDQTLEEVIEFIGDLNFYLWESYE